MELTDNDRQRIEQEIDRFMIERGEHPTRVRNPLYGEERNLATKIAEYATTYERQQQASPFFKGYDLGLKEKVLEQQKELASLRSENEKLRSEAELKSERYDEAIASIHRQHEKEISKLKAERQELVEALRFRIDITNRNFNESPEVPFLESLLAKLNK